MRAFASPVFIARMTDVYFDNNHPPLPETRLELRLFIPGEPPVQEDALPLEYLLQGETADSYVHFLLHGINGASPEQLHRLCLLLLMVREQFYDGIMTFIQTEN